MEDFKIQTYTFGELAGFYMPHVQPVSATRQLKRWILRSKELQEALEQVDFPKHNPRILTPRQVDIIVRHLGLP